MLSRATSSFLRPRCQPLTSRLLLAQCQIRGYRRSTPEHPQDGFRNNSNESSRQNSQNRPLRPISAQHQNTFSSKSAFARSQTSRPSSQPPRDDYTDKQSSEPLPDLRDGIPSDYTSETEAKRPLPDLTQGIPSTIDAELSRAQRTGRASRESLNITEDPEEPLPRGVGDRDGDGLPRSSYVSTSDQKRTVLARLFYLSMLVGGLSYALYTGRDWSEEEQVEHPDIPNGYSPILMYNRAKARFGSTVSYYQDPGRKKLLPDLPPGEMTAPEHVLVVGLEDVLIRSEWTREHGWRIAKRPGLDYFIKYLYPYYELVIFSSQPMMFVEPLYRKLDPFGLTQPLFREETLYEDGGYIKDLSYLNRDVKKVVMIDADPYHAKRQPENAIIIPKWDGSPNDTTLIDLIPFLEYVATMGFQDTRDVLKSFEGKYIPVEFDKRQKMIREKFEADRAQKKSKRSLGSLFGTKTASADGSKGSADGQAQGKMIWDQIREKGQAMYKDLDEQLKTVGPQMLAEREAMEKKMQEEAMAEMKSGMFSWFGGGARGNSDEKK